VSGLLPGAGATKCPVCRGELKPTPTTIKTCETCWMAFSPRNLDQARATRAAEIAAAVADDIVVFEYIVEADKTRYDYPAGQRKSETAKKPDGSLPPVGQCWLTPREKAMDRLKAIRALLSPTGDAAERKG
jgi:hypothetical protein